MTGQLFPDIPRLYTALAEWLACLVFIMQFPRRQRGWRFITLALLFLAVQSVFLFFTGGVNLALWMPCMMAAVALMQAFISACCDLSLISAGYCCVRAFILAEFAAALEWQLHYFFVFQRGYGNPVLKIGLLLAVYAGVFWLSFYLDTRRAKRHTLYVSPREFWPAAVIGIIAFLMSNLSYSYSNTPFSGKFAMDIFNTRTLVDFGGLCILFAYHMWNSELRMKFELDAIQNILQGQYAQYRQSRESIELVNRKYHDLKHQIAVLRSEPDEVRRSAYLDEMESEIKAYEAQNKTGNTVLDTVLTGKSLYCQKHGILLTCVADGTLLHFMDVMDICTIFGNALDNAVESVCSLPDKDKRLIHLSVSRKNDFLMLRCENYFEGALKIEQGLPVSTKGDDLYHGYGLKSIRFSAQKYGGSVTAQAKNNWFELKILVPIPAASDFAKK